MAEARISGVDVEMSYRRNVEWFGGGEHLTARMLASHLSELSTTQVGAAKVDRIGQTGVTGTTPGAPDWQGMLSLSY